MISSTFPEWPSKHRLWQISSPSSHFQTKVAQSTVSNDGRSKLTVRQLKKGGGVGVFITTPDGEILKYGVRLRFPATNNEVEYEGILTGLRLGKVLGVKNLLIQSDSKLVIEQIKGEYKAKEERMQKYLRLTRHLTREFDEVEFIQVPRNQNAIADEI